jgi:hypothetical protein
MKKFSRRASRRDKPAAAAGERQSASPNPKLGTRDYPLPMARFIPGGGQAYGNMLR